MPYITDRNQRIFYTKKGHGPLPALLLIHGAGGSHLDWSLELQRLENTVVYAIDLPGHGRSNGPGRDSIAHYANDVILLIESLGLERVVVAGYSMGGAIAQEIGRRKIRAVSGLVLIGTGASLPVGESLLKLVSTDYSKAAELIVKLSWSGEAPEVLIALAKERLLEVDPEVTYRDFMSCNAFDLREEIASIDMPTLVISGLADRMAPPQHSRVLADRIPNARLVQIEGGSHMVALEKPFAVANAITLFLAEIRLSASILKPQHDNS